MSETSLPPQLQEILQTLRLRLTQALGEQLAQVIVYGSQARGEARPDSDIDVLIVMAGQVNFQEVMQRTSELVAELSLRHDIVISRTFTSAMHWQTAHTPFLINVRREGVPV